MFFTLVYALLGFSLVWLTGQLLLLAPSVDASSLTWWVFTAVAACIVLVSSLLVYRLLSHPRASVVRLAPSPDPSHAQHFLEALADLSGTADQHETTDEVLASVTAAAAQALQVEGSGYFEVFPERDRLLLLAGTGWQEGQIGALELDAPPGTLGHLLLQERRATLSPEGQPPEQADLKPLADWRFASGLSAQVVGRGSVLGVLVVLSTEARQFTADEIQFLESAAGFLSGEIARTRGQQLRRLEAEILDGLKQAADFQAVTSAVLQLVAQGLGYEIAEYWAVDGGGKSLIQQADWRGVSVPAADFLSNNKELRLTPGSGLPGRAWAAPEIQWSYDLGLDPALRRADEAGKLGLQSAVAVPIQSTSGSGAFYGVLVFYTSRKPTLPADIRASLESIGRQLGDFFEQSQAAVVLRKSEERYRSLAEHAIGRTRVGILLLNREHNVAWVNDTLERYFHLDFSQAVGRPGHELIAAELSQRIESGEAFAQAVAMSYDDGEHLEGFECRLPPIDGEAERWLEYSSYPITQGFYEGGRVEYFLDITRRKQLQSEARLRAQQQAAVANLGKRALEELDLDRLASECVRLIDDNLAIDLTKLLELEKDGRQLRLKAGIGLGKSAKPGTVVPVDVNTQLGYSLFSSGPVIVEDYEHETRFRRSGLLEEQKVLSGVSVVIAGREGAYGVLAAHSRQPQSFTEDDVAFLQTVANILADAIDRANSLEALRRAREELEKRIQVRTAELSKANEALQAEIAERELAEESARSLLRISQRLSRSLNIEALLDTLVKETMRLVGAAGGCSGIRKGERLVTHKCFGESGETIVDYAWAGGEGLAGRLLELKSALLIKDAAADPHIDPALRSDFRIRTALAAPIVDSHDEVIAHIELHNSRRAGGFTEFDQERVVAVAQIASVAIQNALAYGKLQKTEEQLTKSKAQLEEAQRIAQIGSWEWDIETDRLTWSAELCRIYGLDPEEQTIDYGRFMELVHPDDRNWMQARIEQTYEDHEPFSFDHRIVTPDGTTKILHGRGRLVLDQGGRPVRMYGTGQDITALKRMEAELTGQKELYESLLAAQSDLGLGVMVTEADRIVYANQALTQITGFSRGELSALPDRLNLIAPKDRLEVKTYLESIAAGNGPTSHEATILHKNGFLRKIEFSLKFTGSGDRQRAFVIVRDISQRKRAQEAIQSLLRISERLNATLDLKDLLDTLAREAIELVQAGAGCAGLRRPEGMVTWSYLIDSQRLPLAYTWPEGHGLPGWLIQHGVPYITNEATSDPQMVPELRDQFGVRSAISTPILNNQGEVIAFFELHNKADGTGFDQDDQEKLLAVSNIASIAIQNALAYEKIQQAEEQLRASSEQLRQFSAHVEEARERERTRISREIHDELGQALTGLKMDLAWMEQRIRKWEPEEQTERLLKKAHIMADLIDETIQTVRRMATELRPGVLDDLGLIAAIEWQVGEFTRRTGIACSLTTNVEVIEVERRLATAAFRILQEALTNVARHAQASQVKVRFKRLDGWMSLEIEDDGIGFPEASGAASGSLGLVGIRERAHLLGGEVEIHSQPEAGTRLRARLPLSIPEADLEATV